MSYLLIAKCRLFFRWQNMMLQLWPHIFHVALGENWQFLWHVQNLQKKKFLYFHLPYFVPPAPYFHLTELDVLPGLSQHPFHYYFCSVWHSFQRNSYVLLLHVFDSLKYLYIYRHDLICVCSEYLSHTWLNNLLKPKVSKSQNL